MNWTDWMVVGGWSLLAVLTAALWHLQRKRQRLEEQGRLLGMKRCMDDGCTICRRWEGRH